MSALGHFDPFPPPRLNGRCPFSYPTSAGASGNGKDVPIPAVRETAVEPPDSTPQRPFTGSGIRLPAVSSGPMSVDVRGKVSRMGFENTAKDTLFD
jgi:hypothetical protein